MSNRIAELRAELARQHPTAFSRRAVALRLGVSEEAVWRWERGLRRPRTRHARALARELGVTVEELQLDDEAADPPEG